MIRFSMYFEVKKAHIDALQLCSRNIPCLIANTGVSTFSEIYQDQNSMALEVSPAVKQNYHKI